MNSAIYDAYLKGFYELVRKMNLNRNLHQMYGIIFNELGRLICLQQMERGIWD